MKLIISDIDGTLLNSMKIDDECFFETFVELYNYQPDLSRIDELKSITSGTDLGLFKHIYTEIFSKQPDLKDVFIFKERFISNSFIEIEGALGFYNELMRIGNYRFAVATGCWSESAVLKLNAIGFDTSKFPISSSDAMPLRKDIINRSMILAEEFYSDSGYEDIIYIGDGKWDLLAAQLCGIRFIGIGSQSEEVLMPLGAEFSFKDYSDLKGLFKAIEKK